MTRGLKRKLAVLGTLAVAGLLGCGLWNWAGHYRYDVGGLQIDVNLSQPNPLAVSVDLTLVLSQLGHDVCKFTVAGCTGTVNLGTDSFHAPGCTLVLQAECIGGLPGDIDGTLLSETSGTVDSFTLFMPGVGAPPVSLPIDRVP